MKTYFCIKQQEAGLAPHQRKGLCPPLPSALRWSNRSPWPSRMGASSLVNETNLTTWSNVKWSFHVVPWCTVPITKVQLSATNWVSAHIVLLPLVWSTRRSWGIHLLWSMGKAPACLPWQHLTNEKRNLHSWRGIHISSAATSFCYHCSASQISSRGSARCSEVSLTAS